MTTLTSERLTFDDAYEAIEAYFQRGWTDGLPVVPPTPERVAEFLGYAGREASETIGTEPVRGRVITAEKVAINAVMAGCLPEYFPVVLAAVEALCEPRFNLHGATVSTQGAAVLVLVSGPIARQLKLNSGVSVFGPGHRANATIGRAVRLVIMNVTGAVPGELDKATLGHAGKYTWCMAEAEDLMSTASGQGELWEPLHVQRGFSLEQSTVTVFAGLSPTQVNNHDGNTPETVLVSFRDAMFAAGPGQGELLVVICPEHLGHIRAAGWSKRQVKEFLFQATQRTVSEWAKAGRSLRGQEPPDAVKPVAQSPDSITVLMAGGAAGGFSQVIPLWSGGTGSRSVTREIGLES